MTAAEGLSDVVLDFETYYDSDYSLQKMTTIEYVNDARFECIGFSIAVGDGPITWHTGSFLQLKAALEQVDWSRSRLVAHNLMFDGAVLEWRFRCHPAQYFCTMMASRPYVAPYTGSQSLGSVAQYLGCGVKGHEVENHRGRRRGDFTPQQLHDYGAYCCNDTHLTRRVKDHLCSWLPEDEQFLLHLTSLKFLRPVFQLDGAAIEDGIIEHRDSRNAMYSNITAMGHTVEDIRSRVKFAKILRGLAVEPPRKISKTTGKETDAFAKDDEEFTNLLAHPNQQVRELVEARLTLASTLEESRLNRFLVLYNMDIGGSHLLPVPLLYYAAHPGRFGGTDSLNLQNLPRPDPANPRKGALRRSMVAPPGYVVMAADYTAVEARIVATLAGQWDLVAAFAAGRDVYSEFASRIYGRMITKADKVERFVGKTCILGLGYGMGWQRFLHVMNTAGVAMDEIQARRIVDLYRKTYPSIVHLWAQLEQLLRNAVSPKCMQSWGPFVFTHERIVLPNNMPIIYPKLQLDRMHGGLFFESKRKGAKPVPARLWGGMITENVVQALARIIATRAEIRLARKGLYCAHQAHDELVWVVLQSWLPKLVPLITRVMRDPVPWMTRLPINVEVKTGASYGDCK